ncbi:MAG: hypothetical protein M3083_22085, partial [Actinomycetota bacterium]|nr:hypothetical protein [Actinomycetota bacterium]
MAQAAARVIRRSHATRRWPAGWLVGEYGGRASRRAGEACGQAGQGPNRELAPHRGARVALVDKAAFPRDKACGDLIGPRGVQVLDDLGIASPGTTRVGDMVV